MEPVIWILLFVFFMGGVGTGYCWGYSNSCEDAGDDCTNYDAGYIDGYFAGHAAGVEDAEAVAKHK